MASRLSYDGRPPDSEDPNKLSKLASQNRHAKNTTLDHAGTTATTSTPTPAPAPAAALASVPVLVTPPSSNKPGEGLHIDTALPFTTSPAQQDRRRFVFPDPVAFRFLEEDPAVAVVERRVVLRGYELYLVEQWACSRQSPTLVVATFTGDDRQSVVAGVLAAPRDERAWSSRLRLYFKAIAQYHGRPKETDHGELFITNLNSFPSALTVIPVPGGDIRKHRQLFIVNEDLKRLGCAGRSATTLSEPSSTTQAKFYQLYHVCDKVPFFQAVPELVKLCQMALLLFGKLEHEYIDGLLCDLTEAAIGNWWTELGAEHYNFDPTDGILGPTTVAALMGMLMGARNRLHYLNAAVPKDVFDIEQTKRGIGHFQKTQKLERTRRLDRPTLIRLHKTTRKAAAGEVWGVQKALSSTISEVGGKRGEMVMGMVGGRDKAGIADVETFDYDAFLRLVSGERAKWLWHGKPRRTTSEHDDKEYGVTLLLGKDDPAQLTKRAKSASFPLADEEPEGGGRGKESMGDLASDTLHAIRAGLESPADKEASRSKVFKSVAGKVSDARSGLGRIKDAVGGSLRGHGGRPSISTSTKDESMDSPSTSALSALAQQSTSLTSPVMAGRAFTWKTKPEEYLSALGAGGSIEASPMSNATASVVETPMVDLRRPSSSRPSFESFVQTPKPPAATTTTPGDGDGHNLNAIATQVRKGLAPPPVLGTPSGAAPVIDDADLSGPVLSCERSRDAQFHLHRRHSIQFARLSDQHPLDPNRWPRRMSFGQVSEAVLGWDPIAHMTADEAELGAAEALAEFARILYQHVEHTKREMAPWAETNVSALEGLAASYDGTHDEVQALCRFLGEIHARTLLHSEELVGEERARATQSLHEMEVLAARLEYEIGALEGKVQDVEDGVELFERQVEGVEQRMLELKVQLEKESFLYFLLRTLTGIGTGPNVTRTN